MKALSLIIAGVVGSILVGCQESSISDPPTGQASVIAGKAAYEDPARTALADVEAVGTADSRRILRFSRTLRDPSRVFNTFVEASGVVAYTSNPIETKTGRYVHVTLAVTATITPLDGTDQYWKVESKAEGQVPVDVDRDADTNSALRTSAQVHGGVDGMNLNINYRMRGSTLEIADMWLSIPGNVDDDGE